MQNLPEIIAGATGLFELVTRGLPTKKNYSLIHGILKALLFVSTFLNNKKESLNKIPVIIFIVLSTVLVSCGITKDFTCLSKKSVTITIKDSNGNYTSTKISYCDSILYSKIVDTTQAIKFVKSKSIDDYNKN